MSLLTKCALKLKKYATDYFDIEYQTKDENIHIVAKNGKYGFLDATTRKLLIPLEYENLFSFYEGLASAKKGGKYGYIDIKNHVVIPFEYDDAGAFKNGVATVKKDDFMGCINSANEQVLPIKYDSIYFDKDVIVIKNRGKCGYASFDGDIVCSIVNDDIGEIAEGMVPVKRGTRWGFNNLEGNNVIPFKYIEATSFEGGYAFVKQNGKIGVINKQGDKIIACRYDYVLYVNDGIACVVLNNRFGYVDVHDRTIIPCELLRPLGESEADYQAGLEDIKNEYREKVSTVKSQRAKDALIREFNSEMKKMADAKVALYEYQTQLKQKQYRTEQLHQDCFEAIDGPTQPTELIEDSVAETVMKENVSQAEIAEFAPEQQAEGEQQTTTEQFSTETVNESEAEAITVDDGEVETVKVNDPEDDYLNHSEF